MDKYKKYYGLIIFCIAVFVLCFASFKAIAYNTEQLNPLVADIEAKNKELSSKQTKLKIVQDKIKKIKDAIMTSQKKIYSPVESDLGSETLFFALYKDVIEMLQTNSIKIKAISYTYSPESDAFVQFGKDVYFVCDVNMELISNYVNLGHFIQDVYQYPYYIRINELDVKPYEKDKKVLITHMSLRLYAHTAPDELENSGITADSSIDKVTKLH